ncbi:V-type ATP synthase subunit D [candidate division KSB1 bacterium]|nr:MAG: V-type ATP synthase subunit D [candidate division KSB1 bacterium]
MARYNVVPTKTNLLKLKRNLSFAQEGYNLLDQKKQILIVELLGLVDKAADIQEKVEKELEESYKALDNAILAMGKNSLKDIAFSVTIDTSLDIGMRRVMGVNLPQVKLVINDKKPYYSAGNTSVWADETINKFKKVMQDLGTLAEMRMSLMRLAREVKKTIRRVNALEKIAIPDYEESIAYIESTLEEAERETFAILKLIKERLEKKRGAGNGFN